MGLFAKFFLGGGLYSGGLQLHMAKYLRFENAIFFVQANVIL